MAEIEQDASLSHRVTHHQSLVPNLRQSTCFSYLLHRNKLTPKLNSLKYHQIFAHDSSVWADLGGKVSSCFQVVLIGSIHTIAFSWEH